MSALKNLPWQAVQHYDQGLSIVDSKGFEVVSVNELAILLGYSEKLGIDHWAGDSRASREMSNEEADEIASLLAAAPKLLAELEFAVKLLTPLAGHTVQVERMRAAIATARGAA